MLFEVNMYKYLLAGILLGGCKYAALYDPDLIFHNAVVTLTFIILSRRCLKQQGVGS